MLVMPGVTEDQVVLVLLSTSHNIHVGSHFQVLTWELPRSYPTPHFTEGETDTYSVDMTGSGQW